MSDTQKHFENQEQIRSLNEVTSPTDNPANTKELIGIEIDNFFQPTVDALSDNSGENSSDTDAISGAGEKVFSKNEIDDIKTLIEKKLTKMNDKSFQDTINTPISTNESIKHETYTEKTEKLESIIHDEIKKGINQKHVENSIIEQAEISELQKTLLSLGLKRSAEAYTDSELAEMFKLEIPTLDEYTKNSSCDADIHNWLNEHPALPVPAELYDAWKVKSLSDVKKNISFKDALTPSSKRVLNSIINPNTSTELCSGTVSAKKSVDILMELETPTDIIEGFFKTYADDHKSWASADIIPEQRRAVDKWTRQLAEKLGGSALNLEDMQSARLSLLDYAEKRGVNLQNSLALRHVNWMYDGMNAHFQQFAVKSNAQLDTHTIKEAVQKPLSLHEIISKDLNGRTWKEMPLSEQLKHWQSWSEDKRKSAMTHPKVSGYNPNVIHPDIIDIPGKTGFPNFDILGNGNEGVAGIKTNLNYIKALANGSTHDEAFKLTYGIKINEWRSNAQKEYAESSRNSDLIDRQLKIYQDKSEKNLKENPEFYSWKPPVVLQINKNEARNETITNSFEPTENNREDVTIQNNITEARGSEKAEDDSWNQIIELGASEVKENVTEISEDKSVQADAIWTLYKKRLDMAEKSNDSVEAVQQATISANRQIRNSLGVVTEANSPLTKKEKDFMLTHIPNNLQEEIKISKLFTDLSS